MNNNTRPGAAVVTMIVLLASVIGISSAVFYINSNRSNTRETTYSVENEQAFACLSSAVDIAAKCIEDEYIVNDPTHTINTCKQEFIALDDETTGSCRYGYDLRPSDNELYFPKLDKDHTEVIVLDHTSGTHVTLDWETDFAGSPAGNIFEIGILKPGGGTLDYTLEQVDYKCDFNDLSAGGNKTFKTATTVTNVDNTKMCKIETGGADGFDANGASYLLITPRYNAATEIHMTLAGTNIPSQGFTIDAKGQAGGVELYAEVLVLNNNEAAIGRIMNNAIYASKIEGRN